MGIIYGWKHKSKIVYIGRTVKSLYERTSQHIHEYNKQLTKSSTMTYKFKIISELENGWDDIEIILIEEVEDDLLGKRERYWYEHYSKQGELWNAALPPLNISYSEPIDIKDRMLRDFVKSQQSKISKMFHNARFLLMASWDYFSRHIGSIEVEPDVFEPNPNYRGEYLDFTQTLINLLDEYKDDSHFPILLKEVIEFYESDSEVKTKVLIKRYKYKENYESLESLMDEAISNGEWYYGMPLKEEPKDVGIFKRFDSEFQNIIGDISPVGNQYESNPHWRYYKPEFVQHDENWKYQEADILTLKYSGRSDFNHHYVYIFDQLIDKFSKSDNFYKLMTYIRGKNAGKMNKYDKIHNRIETEYYKQFDDSLREAIFNKHFYKYDNHHHETYLEVIIKMIKIHMEMKNIDHSNFEFKDDIDKPTINIHDYMVIN